VAYVPTDEDKRWWNTAVEALKICGHMYFPSVGLGWHRADKKKLDLKFICSTLELVRETFKTLERTKKVGEAKGWEVETKAEIALMVPTMADCAQAWSVYLARRLRAHPCESKIIPFNRIP